MLLAVSSPAPPRKVEYVMGSESEVEFELIFAAVVGCAAVGYEVDSGENAVSFCAGEMGDGCAPLRRVASNEVVGLCAKRGNSLPCDEGISVIGGLAAGGSGSPREGDLKRVTHRRSIAAAAGLTRFDFDPGAG